MINNQKYFSQTVHGCTKVEINEWLKDDPIGITCTTTIKIRQQAQLVQYKAVLVYKGQCLGPFRYGEKILCNNQINSNLRKIKKLLDQVDYLKQNKNN